MAQAINTRGPVTGTATSPKKRRKFFLADLYSTAVGKKYVMAITGIAMIGFVVAHMVGNLKMYLGAEDFNHYAEFLKRLLYPIAPEGVVLWLMRGGLLATASCSSHIPESIFLEINEEAVSDARRRGPVLSITGQPADHPAPLVCAEFRYLKFVLMRVE